MLYKNKIEYEHFDDFVNIESIANDMPDHNFQFQSETNKLFIFGDTKYVHNTYYYRKMSGKE